MLFFLRLPDFSQVRLTRTVTHGTRDGNTDWQQQDRFGFSFLFFLSFSRISLFFPSIFSFWDRIWWHPGLVAKGDLKLLLSVPPPPRACTTDPVISGCTSHSSLSHFGHSGTTWREKPIISVLQLLNGHNLFFFTEWQPRIPSGMLTQAFSHKHWNGMYSRKPYTDLQNSDRWSLTGPGF